MDILHLFKQGGPIMWPLLLASIVALTVVIERTCFMIGERFKYAPKTVSNILLQASLGEVESALEAGKSSKDCVARMLVYGLRHNDELLSDALANAANEELGRYERGLTILDTIVTLAPLLGLLGTVTGMIHAFGLLGDQELSAPTAITGGIAEALIATAFGLGIAILAVVPFNWLNSQFEKAKRRLEKNATELELIMRKSYAASESAR